MPRTSVVVAVDDAHLGAIAEVADRLRGAGMTIERTHELLGTVTGWTEGGDIAALRAVDGVASVERERTYRLPPPDAPVQ